MHIKLLSSTPCKRFDFEPMCKDGRGGWVYSQVGADRSIACLQDLWLMFGLSILVEPSTPEDYVETSRLTATMDNEKIGESNLEWKIPNSGGSFHSGSMVYQWMQDVDLNPPDNGLITVSVSVKLQSQPHFLPVDGQAFCYITEEDTNHKQLSTGMYYLKKAMTKTRLSEKK